MALRLQPLPNGQRIVDDNGMPTLAFQLAWQQNIEAIIAQEAIQDGVLQALSDAVAAIQAAQDAADTANAAALAADAAAAAAATAAAGANDAIANIEAGNFDLAAITVDGQRFINDGGTLVLEP